MLTPKETGGGHGRVFPAEIPYSALLSGTPSSTGVLSTTAVLYFSFKPASSVAGYVLNDNTNHYLCRLFKNGTSMAMYSNHGDRYLGSGSFSAAQTDTAAAALNTALLHWFGTNIGHLSNLYVMDGVVPEQGVFIEQSDKVPDLWVWKKDISVAFGTYGGHYDFSNAAALGADVSGNGNDWTVAGTQSDDTPTHNGGVAAWEALAEPAVLDTSRFADVLLRTGTGAAVDITSLNFPPDWVNVKCRSNPLPWYITDSARWDMDALSTTSTAAEATCANCIISLNADGYTIGGNDNFNHSEYAYLDMALRVDPRGGFDIALWTGSGVAQQIAHGLGKTPTFIIVKSLERADNWRVYHAALGATKHLVLNEAWAALTATNIWNDTAPTSTHFTIGTDNAVNASGERYVAYLFTDTDVFKAFSYTGNASAVGPIVNLGGRPLSIPFLKNTDHATANWYNYDAVRNLCNPINNIMMPNLANAEATYTTIELAFRSNGFKVVDSDALINGSGQLHVGLAVLRQPYKYSNAF